MNYITNGHLRSGTGTSDKVHALAAAGQVIDPIEYRRVMGHFATGVTVVTTRQPGGEPCGLTVSAFCSVSLDPPLVLVCVDHGSDSHDCIRSAGYFAVNVLAEGEGESLSRRFATSGDGAKFQGVAFREAYTGAPILTPTLAWLDCRLREVVPAGDHTIFLGEVLAGDATEQTPLLYYRGGYGRFEP